MKLVPICARIPRDHGSDAGISRFRTCRSLRNKRSISSIVSIGHRALAAERHGPAHERRGGARTPALFWDAEDAMSNSSAREALRQRITDQIDASGRLCVASRAVVASSAELIALSRETIQRSKAHLSAIAERGRPVPDTGKSEVPNSGTDELPDIGRMQGTSRVSEAVAVRGTESPNPAPSIGESVLASDQPRNPPP
jgi:hypothetical protein